MTWKLALLRCLPRVHLSPQVTKHRPYTESTRYIPDMSVSVTMDRITTVSAAVMDPFSLSLPTSEPQFYLHYAGVCARRHCWSLSPSSCPAKLFKLIFFLVFPCFLASTTLDILRFEGQRGSTKVKGYPAPVFLWDYATRSSLFAFHGLTAVSRPRLAC